MRVFESYLGAPQTPVVAGQHTVDADYFRRIDALNFAMAHDDGQLPQDLNTADIILLGISRTSKTPTSIYLAQRGYKTANLPLVPGIEPPQALAEPHIAHSWSAWSRAPPHRRDPPQPRADAGRPQPQRIRRPHPDRQRAHLLAPAVRPARLARHRRDAPPPSRRRPRPSSACCTTATRRAARRSGGRRAMAELSRRRLVLASASHFAGACWKARACPSRWLRQTSMRPRSNAICWVRIDAVAIAEALAVAKARAVAAGAPDALVIGADQVLALGQELFSKPASTSEAREQLERAARKNPPAPHRNALVTGGKAVWSHVENRQPDDAGVLRCVPDRLPAQVGDRVCHTVGAYEIEGPRIQLLSAVAVWKLVGFFRAGARVVHVPRRWDARLAEQLLAERQHLVGADHQGSERQQRRLGLSATAKASAIADGVDPDPSRSR